MAENIKERFISRDSTVELPNKPFIKRMLDPTSPTMEIDGEEASVKTMSMDGKLFPTVVPQEQADGSYSLVQLKPKAAYDLAMDTGNYLDVGDDADFYSKVLSKEAGERRRQYKNNQNFLSQGGKGIGDVEFRADMESAISDDSLSRLGYELYRRGIIDLAALPMDMDKAITRKYGGNEYYSLGQAAPNLENLTPMYESKIRTQNPLTKEQKYEKPIAAFSSGEGGLGRPRGSTEMVAAHELRHAAIDYLMNTTDMSKNKLFKNLDYDVEEDLMDTIDTNKIAKGKKENNPEFTSLNDTFDASPKLNPKYIGRDDRLKIVDNYATQALKNLDVPEYTEQKKPSLLKKLFGMEQGGIMMAQQGKMPLPMEEATSAPQGGGPKAANPAAQPEGLGAPTGATAPAGSSDPRDEAIKEVAQKMQSRSAPAPIPAEVPQMAPPVPPTGLAAPMEEVPMMAKGGMADDSGMSVMIGLGAPPADYEKAAEGNPPPGATKEEVADDQLVLLSEGELVVPANVVRYHGLGAYEGMRRDALMGLQDMETNGQIEYVSGGAEKADKVDDDGGIIKANRGTYLGNPSTFTQNPAVPQAASSQYVQVPGTQGMNPAINPVTGLAMPVGNALQPLSLPGMPTPGKPYQPVTTASSVYAPNVGSYAGDGTDDAADDSTDDSTDDGTGTDETEEERRRRLAAQNAGDGGDNPEEYTGATTVFGGTSQDGMIRGGKQYQIAYESSSKQKVPGMVGALMNIGNLDQVRLTDPTTGQSVSMSKAKYDSMKENRTDAANISFIDTLMQNQAGIDYNRTRAGAIAPFKTGLAVAGEALGFGNAPGTSVAEQNEYARSLAGSLGIDYNGQSMAEVMASPEYNAPREGALPPVRNRQFDPMGNPITDGRYDGQASTPQGLAAPEVAYGAGQFSGAPAQPVAVDSFAGPYTQPTLGLTAPTTEAGRLAQSITPAGNTSAVAMSMPNQKGIGDPATEAGRLAQFAAPTRDTVAYTPDEAARLASFVAPAGNTSAVARQTDDIFSTPAMSSSRDSGTRASERSREVGRSTSPTLEGISQTGNYGIEAGDFDTPDNQGANMDDDAPAASRDMSTREGRKAAADERAQEQTGNPNSTAVTDKDGNPVTSTNPDGSKSVVTNTPPSSNGGGGPSGCVIATHAVANDGFSNDVKREAVRWCVKNLHKRWYGEAVRRGYRYHGIKAIEAGRAHNHYEEFKDYVDFATGRKRSLTNLGTFVYRTAQFFITGLFLK
ncbi:MAG: hypothetical protein CBD88_08040 [Flavobacteriales bacterium TMED228]|nr:MAG: hypothetical protein CBD88_08040 [Flavobacteriales bacterium TMED228]